MISGTEKCALWVSEPLLRKESDRRVLRDFQSFRGGITADRSSQSRRQITAWTERQMSHLCCSRIHFDQIRFFGVLLQQEIKSVEPGNVKSPNQFFGGSSNLLVLDETENACRAISVLFVDNFKMESREDLAFPASDQAGCIAAWYEFLYVYNRLSTLKCRAHPPHIAIDQHSLDNPNQTVEGTAGPYKHA